MSAQAPSHVPAGLVRAFDFNYRGPIAELFSRFDALRDEGRALWLDVPLPSADLKPVRGAWLFTRASDIRAALQNTELFSSAPGEGPTVMPPMIPIFLDPPEHTRYRRLLTPLFSPAVIKQMEPAIRARVERMVDALAARGSCEFVSDFAVEFPTRVFTSWIGLPEAETPRFVQLNSVLIHSTSDQERAVASMSAIQVLTDLIKERSAQPRDDLMSRIIALDFDGRALAHDELLRIAMLLFLAGLDTVAAALSFSFWHLAQTPADRRALARKAVPTSEAVEELLRRHTFVNLPRRAARDAEFAGVSLRKGDMVILSLPLASRDPSEFERPTEVQLDRPSNRHFAFGLGPHRCLGSHLARLELQVALDTWHRRIPDYRLDGEVSCYAGTVMGITHLPLRWQA